ncbi:hypothetical protein B0H13DRAFT_324877 [Mycena leptocephala]|nr:hypothetical protein B0H13DRAFT_324877 [Mycena leptocephala]
MLTFSRTYPATRNGRIFQCSPHQHQHRLRNNDGPYVWQTSQRVFLDVRTARDHAERQSRHRLRHFGAIEWKDSFGTGRPVYEPTGKFEPMWTMVNSSSASDQLHELYLDAFEGTPDTLRMAMIAPQVVNGVKSMWYGRVEAAPLGIRTFHYWDNTTARLLVGRMSDGGWSKLDVNMAVTQINVILRLISSLDAKFVAGQL